MKTHALQATLANDAPLGQKTPYPTSYDKSLLFAVKRNLQREVMGFSPSIEFFGFDVWNDYELFWLNTKGKPVRSYGTFIVPSSSVNLLESKSVKLYLNSFNHQRFLHAEEVHSLIVKDMSEICHADVRVILSPSELGDIVALKHLKYRCIDELDIAIEHYHRRPQLLVANKDMVTEQKLVSHLFKSHCLCTGQPDFASIFIDYVGAKLDEEGLLAYLISYRDHVGFAENCIEQIYVDIMDAFAPEKLTVFGRFTRRGGIDINPYRSSHEIKFENMRLIFQ